MARAAELGLAAIACPGAAGAQAGAAAPVALAQARVQTTAEALAQDVGLDRAQLAEQLLHLGRERVPLEIIGRRADLAIRILEHLAEHATLVVVPEFDPVRSLEEIERYGVTVVPVAPAVLAHWRGRDDLAERLAGVRTVMSHCMSVLSVSTRKVLLASGPAPCGFTSPFSISAFKQ